MPILEDGQLFERYRVHRWLGGGVAGESYEAEDRILQRKVTLKLIHPWATLPDSARRQFFREMQGISLLNHPYLATVLDYGEAEGRMYVARRYVSSGSLLGTNGRIWFHPPLPVADAFKYAHQLAQALQYIHQHGYLHGSFTFANVLVLRGPNSEHDADYAPFLMADVGLATFVRRFGHPRIETLPVSAAPEQLGKRATPASDQFALAVLLYFWLAGRPPYLGTASEVEYQKLSETITPLSILNPGVTLEQDNIILRALTVYPEDRYPSVLAFTEELIASLSSAHQLYAPSLAPLPETPPVLNTRVVQDKVPVNEVEADTQVETAHQTQATAAETPAAEIPTPTSPSQSQVEPYRSALDELLALSPAKTGDVSFDERASRAPIEEREEEIEGDQPEDFALFPVLPETPPVGELPTQAGFAFVSPEEPEEQQTSKQTGPLAAEPDVDILHAQANEPALEIPLELPGSTDFTSLDEIPPASGEVPSTIGSDEPTSIDEEETPTVPREEFARASKESETLLSSDDPAFLNETFTPAALPDQPLLPDEAAALAASLSQPLPTSEVSTPILSTNDSSVEPEEQVTSSPFDDPTFSEKVSSPVASYNQFFSTSEASLATALQEEFTIDEEGFVRFSPDDFSAFSELVSPVILPDAPLLSNEEDIPTVPLQAPATSTNEDEPSLSRDMPAHFDEESIPVVPQTEIVQIEEDVHPLVDQIDILAEDARILAEQAEVLEEDAHTLVKQADILAEDAHTLMEQTELQSEAPPVSEETAPTTVPLKEPTRDPEESVIPLSSSEPVSPDEANTSTTRQDELALLEEDPHILVEPVPAPRADTFASLPASAFDEEIPTQSPDDLPIQDVHETSEATYEPIDEAIIAPRLLISSPYTSSSYEFLLIDEETSIGRAGASNLYLEQDNLTSRHHALLKRVGERALIFDKRSHNGVFLNGQKIEVGRGYELADGDHIGIGNYELIFRSAPAGHVSQLI